MFSSLAQSSLMVNVVGGGLVAVGVVLFVVTLNFWRSAPADPEVLAPLEVMEDRGFARADDEERVNLLNRFRPRGAAPIAKIQAPPQLLRSPETDSVDEFVDADDYDDFDDDGADVPSIIDPLLRGAQKSPSARSPRNDGYSRGR